MIKFGTIGTNWITDKFIEAGKADKRFEVSACYSRKLETAQDFATKHNIPFTFANLDEMAKSNIIDAVYIASPNSCHYEQAKLFLEHKIHVLCEKPLTTTAQLAESLYKIAEDNNVLLMHALKNLFEPRIQKLHNLIPMLGKLRLVNLTRCQYSSRYDDYKKGIILNAFNPSFGNGAIMDIGIYLIQPMVHFLGTPKNIVSSAVMLENGIDGAGTIIAHYGDMQAVLSFSKISSSFYTAEIQGENGSIFWDTESREKSHILNLALKNQPLEKIKVEQVSNSMQYEIIEFMNLLETTEKNSSISRANDTISSLKIIDEYKKTVGLKF